MTHWLLSLLDLVSILWLLALARGWWQIRAVLREIDENSRKLQEKSPAPRCPR